MTRHRLLALSVLLPAVLAACATYRPAPLEQVPFLGRSQTVEREGLTVTVAVPTNAEARKLFGVDLAKERIQPVWVEIRNDTNQSFWFMQYGLDPHYYSAREAAYKSHWCLRGLSNAKMDEHFAQNAFDPELPSGGGSRGFVFSNLKLGTKEVRIRLFGEKRVEDFQFYVNVPGFKADWHHVDFDTLYAEEEIKDLQTDEALYEALDALPCCTTRLDGGGKGDPINIVVLGSSRKLGLTAFLKAGWDETELLTWSSGWRTFKAFFGGSYKYSPMSALYVFGRPQDVSLQKARDTIHERNHLRLWLAPFRFRGRDVFVGSITRDIGVYFTTRAWNFTTHAIDPHVDEARTYLTEDLATAQTLRRIGLVPGVGVATPDEPHRNLMMAPWWTDGMREVYDLSDDPVPLEELEFFPWTEDVLDTSTY